jgi:hypothetical protein
VPFLGALFCGIFYGILAAALAAPVPKYNANQVIIVKPALPSNRDVLRLVFPDIDEKGTAHSSVQIRHISNDYEAAPMSGEMSVAGNTLIRVRNAGRQDLLAEMDVKHKGESVSSWGGETLLALVRSGHPLRLLDVVDVRRDRESGLWNHPTLLDAGACDSPVYYYSHLNAGEDHLGLEILEIVHDKFTPSKVGLPTFYSIRLQNTNITTDITEEPSLRSIPHSTPPQALFTLKLTGKVLDADSDTVTKTEVKKYKATLTANNGRWRCAGCEAVAKAALNMEKRFGLNTDQ